MQFQTVQLSLNFTFFFFQVHVKKPHFQKLKNMTKRAPIVVSSNFEIQPRKLLHLKTMVNPRKHEYSIFSKVPVSDMYRTKFL